MQSADTITGNTIVADIGKKKQKIYWDEDTEAAVREYLSLDFDHLSSKLNVHLKERLVQNYDTSIDDGYVAELESKIAKSQNGRNQVKKELIFAKRIKQPLYKLIENIIFSFKLFRYDIDVKTLHNDCMSHVYEKFYKFNPDQNTKSFSYFGTIAKHYLQNKKKELDMLKSVNLNYEDHREEVDERENYEIDGPEPNDEMMDLFYHMIGAFEKNMTNKALNDNDKKVLDSVLELFKSQGKNAPRGDSDFGSDTLNSKLLSMNWDKNHGGGNDVLDDNKYSKGNILDFISDRSKLTKDEMSKSLTKLRNLYKEKKKEFFNKDEN